jgi:hypothetical protein
MMRIALALALLALLAPTPVEAHCFARWYYPWPQRCGGAIRDNTRIGLHHVLSLDRPKIALPSLAQADLDGGAADEPTRARLLLRAALEAANGH